MNNTYLTLEQAADYLGVSEDTVKRYVDRGELPQYKLDRALRFRFDDLDELLFRLFEVLLIPGLRAAVKHSVQAQEGIGAWRIKVSFYNTKGDKRLVVPFGARGEYTEYFVWVTEEYLDDHAHLPATIIGAEKFALRYIRERFNETKDRGGNPDIRRINENNVVCAAGKCLRGNDLTLHDVPKIGK